MTELLPKPNRADYRGENSHECYLIDDKDYYKRLAEFAIEALTAITASVPPYSEGSFINVYFDSEGNELGVEQIDPMTIIQQMGNRALEALSRIKQSEGN